MGSLVASARWEWRSCAGALQAFIRRVARSQSLNRVYLRDLAQELNRSPHTIRSWETEGILPKSLLPKRDKRGWRYWTPSQVDKVKAWMRANRRAPGAGLNHFQPSTAKAQEMLVSLREPRQRKRKCPQCGDESVFQPPYDGSYRCRNGHTFTEEEFQRARKTR